MYLKQIKVQSLKSRRRKLLITLVAIVVVGVVIFSLKTPTSKGDWVFGQEQLPSYEVVDNWVHIQGVRDFKYALNGKVVAAQYRDVSYPLNGVKQVWYGLSHFDKMGLAHAFLSFEFNNGQYLVSSIEARLEKGQSYNPFKGLLRAYSRIMVLGTENDVIGLRTHYRNERVLLYPLNLKEDARTALFKSILKDAQSLYKKPDFYNTAVDNCITGIVQYAEQWNSFINHFNYRVFLPGYSDQLVYKYGYIDGNGSMEALRVKAQIAPSKVNIESESFSEDIRQAWK